jgi:DNA-binding transcriptional LysR family regulator
MEPDASVDKRRLWISAGQKWYCRERRLDVGLRHDYDTVPAGPEAALDQVALLDETVYLAVPAGDPATALGAVRDADWILASPGTLCHTATVQGCRAAGFSPRARHHADDFSTVLALVAAGQGVSLVPELAGRSAAAGGAAGRAAHPAPHARRLSAAAGTHPGVAAFTAALATVHRHPEPRKHDGTGTVVHGGTSHRHVAGSGSSDAYSQVVCGRRVAGNRGGLCVGPG